MYVYGIALNFVTSRKPNCDIQNLTDIAHVDKQVYICYIYILVFRTCVSLATIILSFRPCSYQSDVEGASEHILLLMEQSSKEVVGTTCIPWQRITAVHTACMLKNYGATMPANALTT